MSKINTAVITAIVTGDGIALTDSDTITNNQFAVAPTAANLASGNNTIAIPSGALGVKIKPTPTNAVALTFKGVTGDTGFAISPNEPSYIALPSSTPASFVISAGGAGATVMLIWT